MKRPFATALTALALATPALADDSRLVGTWRLASFVTEFQDGSPSRQTFGARPTGFLVFTPERRLITLIEAEGRKPANTDEERAALMRSTLAWTGTYTLQGDRMVLKVDAAWNPAITGTERVSTWTIDGNRLVSIAPWAPSPGLPGSPMTRGITTWERVR